MKPIGFQKLLQQKTDSETGGMREKPWRPSPPKGMGREAEGPKERRVTRLTGERGLEQKVMVNSI